MSMSGMRRPRDLASCCLLWATPLRLHNTSLSRDCRSCIHQIRWQRHWGLAPVGRGVAQFREFADKLYAKRRVHERMNELIGGLVLDEELAAVGLRDVNDEERRGWGAVHWRAAGWLDIGLRGRINEALRVLDEAASEADAQYECTFGDSKRVRDKSNPQRAGEGFCPRTKLAAVRTPGGLYVKFQATSTFFSDD